MKTFSAGALAALGKMSEEMAATERRRRPTRLWQRPWHRHPRASVSRSSASLPVENSARCDV